MGKRLVTKGWDRDILADYESEKLPLAMFNLTRRCNYKCIYCHTNAGESDSGELTLEQWKRVTDEVADLGSPVIWIGGRGEPILDKAFEGLIRYIHGKGLTTILNTNGSLVTKGVAKLMHDNDVSPEVKIISFDEKAYDRLAGIKGKLPQLKKGLWNLVEAGYDKVIDETDDYRLVRASGMMLLAKPAYASMPDVFKFCKEYNFAPVVSDVVASGRVVTNQNLEELQLTKEENKRLADKAEKIMGFPIERGYADCHIQYGLVIQNTGDVMVDRFGMSCDVCDYQGRRSLGNVKEMSVKEAWKAVKAERQRNKEKIAEAFRKFQGRDPTCFSACPMMIQSKEDYFALKERERKKA
jgi:MoaA/NifB/PqqE/SkfB family radical SAM enzyme